jgi:hypothetical protein
MTFRFVGTECEFVGMTTLRELGEKIDLDSKVAEKLLASPVGPALLPEAVFSTVGFTPAELVAHRWVSSHDDAPGEFQKKKHAALTALHHLRARLAAGDLLVEESK